MKVRKMESGNYEIIAGQDELDLMSSALAVIRYPKIFTAAVLEPEEEKVMDGILKSLQPHETPEGEEEDQGVL